MSITTLQPKVRTKTRFSQRDKWALRQQRFLLTKAVSKFDDLLGLAARVVTPVEGSTRVPLATHRRPVVSVLSFSADGRCLLSGSVAKFDEGRHRMRYKRIFQYDIGLPFAEDAAHSPPSALLLAKRPTVNLALALLKTLVYQPPVDAAWPEIHCDASGVLYEDFSSCFGLEVSNPSANTEVRIALPNPAFRILRSVGLDAHELLDLSSPEFLEFVSEVRRELGPAGEVVPEEAIVHGLEEPENNITFSLNADEAYPHFPTEATQAVLSAASRRYGKYVCWSDAERAVSAPANPMVVEKMSTPQTFFSADALVGGDYEGDLLPEASWRPQRF
jgi:hypothetical protein